MILFLKHIDIEGPGIFENLFEKEGFDIKVIDLDKNSVMPEDSSGIKAVVILGGPMNVYQEDEHSFLKDENNFIQMLIKKKIPCLGICLGAQLLAKALGAKVRKSSVREIGFHDVCLTEDGLENPLFEGLGYSMKAFQWHEDTFDIPKKGMLLAESMGCENQAFYFGENVYGLQFHVEVDGPMIENWMKTYWNIEDISKDKKAQEIVKEYDKIKSTFDSQANIICKNFVKIIREK